jgi:hypothetical protein
MIQVALWLDASDAATVSASSGVVDQWSDKSGNNRHATGTGTARPALTASGLDGKSVITFDGTDDALFITPSFLIQPNVLIVCVVKENNGGFGGVISSESGTNNQAITLNIVSNRTYEADYGNRFLPATTSTGASWGVLAATYTPAYTNIAFNGTVQGTTTGSATLVNDNSSPAQVIGKYRIFDGNFGAIDLAELVVSTSGGEAFERQRLEGYLAHKWGLLSRLPAEHPYKVTPPKP